MNPQSSSSPEWGDPLDISKPNYQKKFANLHYHSEASDEVGCIYVRPETSALDIMNQYFQKFPKEANIFINEVKWANETLKSEKGMSELRTIMTMGKIPEVVMCAMKFIREDYWEDKRRTLSFFRAFPKLMVGNHNRKDHGNVIVK
jgi:hypothetical protein